MTRQPSTVGQACGGSCFVQSQHANMQPLQERIFTLSVLATLVPFSTVSLAVSFMVPISVPAPVPVPVPIPVPVPWLTVDVSREIPRRWRAVASLRTGAARTPLLACWRAMASLSTGTTRTPLLACTRSHILRFVPQVLGLPACIKLIRHQDACI